MFGLTPELYHQFPMLCRRSARPVRLKVLGTRRCARARRYAYGTDRYSDLANSLIVITKLLV